MVHPTISQTLIHRAYTLIIIILTAVILFTSIYSFALHNLHQLTKSTTTTTSTTTPLLSSISPPISSSSTTSFFKFLSPSKSPQQQQQQNPQPPPPISDLHRIRHVLRRLSFYDGAGLGSARITHVVVSLLGIFGMFAAVIGALLAPWLSEAGNSILDDDQFIFWLRANDDDDDDDDDDDNDGDFRRAFGPHRETKFSLLRMLDVP